MEGFAQLRLSRLQRVCLRLMEQFWTGDRAITDAHFQVGVEMASVADHSFFTGQSLEHELHRQPAHSFLVQTNYDRTGPVPSFDDRRGPAIDCLEHRMGGPTGYNVSSLYSLLSTVPNLNKLTTYTAVMHAASGRLESYRQLCVDRKGWLCPLW